MGSVLSLSVACVPKVFWANTPAYFAARTASVSQESRTSLRAFVESRVPSLLQEFRPAWWLALGHLQTLYSVIGDFSKIDKVAYDRTLLRLKDGGTIGLDSTPPANERTLDDDTPIVVVLHGLTGGSHESYVRAILCPAITPVKEGGLGFRGIVVNFRGCAGVPLTSTKLYSAGHTDDIRQAVTYIAHKYPNAPLLSIGFSLGANVMTRYVAQEGEECRFVSACALANTWDIVKNSRIMETSFLGRHVYSKALAGNLRRLLERHLDTMSKFPDSPLSKGYAALVQSPSKPALVDFDNNVTRFCGGSSPPFPFETAWDYYAWAASHKYLKDIRIPFLAINAEDDPIVQEIPIDAGGNGWVAMAVTERGGHLGWFEASGPREARRWVSKPVLEWLNACARDIVPERQRGHAIKGVDGWLVEEGREHLGCRVVEEGGKVEGAAGEEGLLAGL